MVKTAFLFPGQGAQHVGMGKELSDRFSKAKQLFEEASDILKIDIFRLCFEGPEETLTLTANAQPAILIHSIIALKCFGEHDIDCSLAAGHSLGEFSALVAAGALSFSDAVQLVRKRGQFMQEAVPVGVGGMAAIIGLPLKNIQEICDRISSEGHLVQPANINSPGQIVVAGHLKALEQASEECKRDGAKKSVLLPVSAPFHCSLMKPAELKLQVELEKTTFNDLDFPIITNVDAQSVNQGDLARDALRRQVCSPVRWIETMESLVRQGIKRVIEFGPGKVLSGLMKRLDKSVECLQVNDSDSLDKSVSSLK